MCMIKNKKTIDGDTFQGSDNKFYRLAGVNTPEKHQRGFQKAKEKLDSYLSSGQLVIDEIGVSYNRKVVNVRKVGEKKTINTKMKRLGYK